MSKKKKKTDADTNITTIRIDAGNEIGDPDKLIGAPGSLVSFTVENRDGSNTHTVSINPKKVKNKKGAKLEDPFKKGTSLNVTVHGGDTAIMSAYLKSKFKFKKEEFKYTIDSDDKCRDPDLDVVDPNPIIPKKR